MIRRDPTLIPMTDSDVQDIRDMIEEAKKAAALQKADVKMDTAVVPPVPGFAAQEEAQRQREAMSKNERLGL